MNNNSVLSKLREMRNWDKKAPEPAAANTVNINVDDLKKAVNKDVGLDTTKKQALLELINHPSFINEMRSGGAGAALAYLITKFLNLSGKSQLLLSIAGFGLGKLIYDYIHNNKSDFATYNKDLKMYEIRD